MGVQRLLTRTTKLAVILTSYIRYAFLATAIFLLSATTAAPTQTAEPPPTLPSPSALPTGQNLTDTYTVTVIVDETAENTQQARDKALQKGQNNALQILISRLFQPTITPSSLQTENITDLIASFEINDEKTTENRYSANLIYHFTTSAVQAFLKQKAKLITNRIIVSTSISDLNNWILLKSRLKKVPEIWYMKVISIARNKIELELEITSSSKDIKDLFQRHGFILTKFGELWTLTLAAES